MALTITPTSGAGPYTLSIELTNKTLLDGVRYELVVQSSIMPDVCPVSGSTPNNNVRDALLKKGYYVRASAVSENRCLVYTVNIIDLDNSVVIDTQNVFVDNVL